MSHAPSIRYVDICHFSLLVCKNFFSDKCDKIWANERKWIGRKIERLSLCVCFFLFRPVWSNEIEAIVSQKCLSHIVLCFFDFILKTNLYYIEIYRLRFDKLLQNQDHKSSRSAQQRQQWKRDNCHIFSQYIFASNLCDSACPLCASHFISYSAFTSLTSKYHY